MTRSPAADHEDHTDGVATPSTPDRLHAGTADRIPAPGLLPDPRPLHLRPTAIAVVAAGGTMGTAAREAISWVAPAPAGIPVAILAVNVTGAFLLGLLLEALVRRGPDQGRRRMLRLLLGTGVLGGFTTYSALAADAAGLIGDGRLGAGAGYALVSVLVGAAATAAGIVVAGRRNQARRAVR